MTTTSLRNTFQQFGFGTKEQLDENAFARKLGLLAKLVGCRHERISRPFGEGNGS